MKHPNKKLEKRFYLLSKDRLLSCFNNWVHWSTRKGNIPMTEANLLAALVELRRGGKTIPVDIETL